MKTSTTLVLCPPPLRSILTSHPIPRTNHLSTLPRLYRLIKPRNLLRRSPMVDKCLEKSTKDTLPQQYSNNSEATEGNHQTSRSRYEIVLPESQKLLRATRLNSTTTRVSKLSSSNNFSSNSSSSSISSILNNNSNREE